MEINITGRNMHLDADIKDYVHKRLDKLERLHGHIYKCEVVLEEEKLRKNAEIILHLKNNFIVAKESSPDLYASIDSASDNIKRQVRRLHDKLSAKRRRGGVVSKIISPITRLRRRRRTPSYEGKGTIVKSNAFADKPMLPDEAKLELDVLEKDFIMFKNADTGEANVMYKKKDGNYGLIEPNF